jgi:inositol phosphorylceramide synthase catalytic subunit
MNTADTMQEFNSFLAQPKPKLPFLWPSTLNLAQFNPIPYKFRPSRKLRMRQRARSAAEAKLSGMENVTKLQTSFNVMDTLRHLRRRQWKLLDLQHLIIAGFILFCMLITPSAPFIKLAMLAGYSLLLLMPITQQFFLPSLPIWTYLIYFFSSR